MAPADLSRPSLAMRVIFPFPWQANRRGVLIRVLAMSNPRRVDLLAALDVKETLVRKAAQALVASKGIANHRDLKKFLAVKGRGRPV